MGRDRPVAPALAAAGIFVAVAVLVTIAWQLLGDAVTDIPLYRTYGERVADGLVPYRDFAFEYPPGALPALVLPALVTDSLEAYRVAFVAELALVGALAADLPSRVVARHLTARFEDCGAINVSRESIITLLEPFLSKIWFCGKLILAEGKVLPLPTGTVGPRLLLDDGTTDGQLLILVLTSGTAISLDTSVVATGTTVVVQVGASQSFIWLDATSTWHPESEFT